MNQRHVNVLADKYPECGLADAACGRRGEERLEVDQGGGAPKMTLVIGTSHGYVELFVDAEDDCCGEDVWVCGGGGLV